MNYFDDPRICSFAHETPDGRKPVRKTPIHTKQVSEGYHCASCGAFGKTGVFWTATECAACHYKRVLNENGSGILTAKDSSECTTSATSIAKHSEIKIGSSPPESESEPQERDGWVNNQGWGKNWWMRHGDGVRCGPDSTWFYWRAGNDYTADHHAPSWPALKAALLETGELKCQPAPNGSSHPSTSGQQFTTRASSAPIAPSLRSNAGKYMPLKEMPAGTVFRNKAGERILIKSKNLITIDAVFSDGHGSPSVWLIHQCEGEREVISDPVVENGDRVSCVEYYGVTDAIVIRVVNDVKGRKQAHLALDPTKTSVLHEISVDRLTIIEKASK